MTNLQSCRDYNELSTGFSTDFCELSTGYPQKMPYLSTENDLYILLRVYYSLHFVIALIPVCGCALCAVRCALCAVLTIPYIIQSEKQNTPPPCFHFSTL